MALRIAITTGDPAGIGSEVALKSIPGINSQTHIPILIGRKEIYEAHFPDLFRNFSIIEDIDGSLPAEKAPFFYNVPQQYQIPQLGKGTTETGIESKAYIDTALSLWKSGKVNALVTGPVSKSLIEKSGTHFTGHTEYIADAIGEKAPLMMMFSEKYRVLLTTTHIPLNDVTGQVSMERLLYVMENGYKSIKSIDGDSIRIAVAGLEPHCGDEGAISTFDEEVTKKAVLDAQLHGIPIQGPFAADTLFLQQKWSQYNLIIAQYHDQGLIPFKMLAFDSGVNVTLGLSIVRTSVDHGTAFDIAGKDRAHYQSMVEAFNLACKLVKDDD